MHKITIFLVSSLLTCSLFALSQKANKYVCQDEAGLIKATFKISDKKGERVFSLQGNGFKKNFSAKNDAVRVEKSVLGMVVSAHGPEFVPDLYSTSIGLILPNVNTFPDGKSSNFNATYFKVTHQTSIAGDQLVRGALEKVSYTTLSCTASATHSL